MRVLVLGAGGAAANGYCRALRLASPGYHIVGANIDPDGLLLAECDETHLLPPPGETGDALWQLCQRTRPDFVHAQPDEEVLRLSRFRNIIRPARHFLPSHDAIVTCQDKWLSHLAWKKANVPQPDTVLVRGRESLFNTIEATGHERWLRLRSGAGGAGAIKTDSYELARLWVHRHDGWGKFTSAAVLPGRSVTWTSVWWQGELVASQQRLRRGWANGRNAPTGVSGSTGVGETCSDPRVEEVAPAACLAIDEKPHGLWSVDMTYDAFGVPNPTEINPGRFFTTVPEFFARAGFNVAHIYTKLGYGWIDKPIREGSLTNPLPDGVRFLRLMDKAPVLA